MKTIVLANTELILRDVLVHYSHLMQNYVIDLKSSMYLIEIQLFYMFL